MFWKRNLRNFQKIDDFYEGIKINHFKNRLYL